MTVERNKDVVRKFCDCVSARDVDGALSFLEDGGSWSVPYRDDCFQYGGLRYKEAERTMLKGFFGGFREFSFKITAILAEGDLVAIEAASTGVGPGTASYKNTYSMNFVMRDGQIHTIRERFDPFEVLEYAKQLPQG